MPRIESGDDLNAKVFRTKSYVGSTQWVSFDQIECIKETEKALLCIFPDGRSHWMPKSQMHRDSAVQHLGDTGTLICSQWIVDQKELSGGNPTSGQKASQAPRTGPTPRDAYKLYRVLIRKYHPDVNSAEWAGEVARDLTSLWQAFLKGV